MEMRKLHSSDIDALTTVAQRSFNYDELARSYIYERVWGDPDHDDALALGMWEGSRLVAFCIAVIRGTQKSPVGYIKLFATDPDLRGRGLGSALLSQIETELASKGVQQIWAGGSAPWYIFAGIDVRYTPALLMLQKAGYKHSGDAVNLYVDLRTLSQDYANVLAKPTEHGYVLRRMVPSDAGTFTEWAKKTWNTNWSIESLMALQQSPISAFLALKDNNIVGFATYDGARPGWFGPMGTEAQLRGQGIGGALYLLCLEDMRRKGYSYAEISWAGPVAFYSKLSGAYIHRVFRRMQKEIAITQTSPNR